MDYSSQKLRVCKYEVLGVSKDGLEIRDTYIDTSTYCYDDDEDDLDYVLDDDYGVYTE